MASRQEAAEHSERTGTRQETEKSGSLLSRLKQEAEGIRRWQTSVDMELRNKGEHIREMTSLIEEQRKSLLEVQLEYEKVSGLLQEERGNQEQLGKQLTQTRDLFSAVKENVERIEDEVRKGGDDGNDLSQFQDQLIRRYEELRESYLLLQSRCEEVNKDLLAELRESREECGAVKERNEILIEETAKLIKDISDKTQVFEESLENLSADLCQKESACSELTRERDSLSALLSTAERELESMTTECQQANSKLVDRARELEENREQTELLKSKYSELTAELAVAKSEKESLQTTNASLQQQVTELEETQNRLREGLSETENKLDSTCTQLANRDGELLVEREACSSARERIIELEREAVAQEDRLRLSRDELLVASEELRQMEQERTDLNNQVTQLQDSLASTSAGFEADRAVLSLEISNQKELVARVELEREDTRRLLSLSEDTNNKLTEDIGSSVKKCEETQILLNAKTEEAALLSFQLNTAQLQISGKTSELQQISETVENVRLEKVSLIESHSRQLSDLESSKLEELAYHLDELSRIKASNESQLKMSIEEIEQKHSAQLEAVTMDKQKLLSEKLNTESELKVLKEQSLSDKQQLEHARGVAAESQEQGNKRVSEMLDSLCKYKKEGEEILSAKNKEIEELKVKQASELEQELSKVTLQFNEDLSSVRNEKQKLEILLSNIQKERRQEHTVKRSVTSTPKLPDSTHSYSLMRTPCTPLASSEPLQYKTPNYRGMTQPAPPSARVENGTEKRQTGEAIGANNFRTPSLHANSNLKQKRKKIRLDDVSMEILNSQDDISSKHSSSSKPRPTRPCSTPSRSKENIPSATYASKSRPTRQTSAKSKLSKEYNWFDNDVVFGLGTDD